MPPVTYCVCSFESKDRANLCQPLNSMRGDNYQPLGYDPFAVDTRTYTHPPHSLLPPFVHVRSGPKFIKICLVVCALVYYYYDYECVCLLRGRLREAAHIRLCARDRLCLHSLSHSATAGGSATAPNRHRHGDGIIYPFLPISHSADCPCALQWLPKRCAPRGHRQLHVLSHVCVCILFV